MSHYNKWAGGGYYYGDWWKKKKDKKKDKKSGSSSTPTTPATGSPYPSTSVPGSSGSSAYGGYGSYGSYGGYGGWDDYDDDEVVDYKEVYRSRYKSSLGYSSSRLTSSATWWAGGGAYSYYGTAGRSSGDAFEKLKLFLVKATKEARDLIVILDFPFKVRIDYTLDWRYLPKDVKRIFVPTRMITDSSIPDEEKISIFCGLAIHEAAHLKYTEYRVINSFESLISSSKKKYSMREMEFMKTLVMMIEDERVEDCLLKERPGYLEFIDIEKNHEYKRFIDSSKVEYEDGAHEFQQFFVNLYKLVRFPENVDVEFLNKYQDLYDEIGHIITPLPGSSKEVCIVAEKVYSAIRDAFKLDEMTDADKTKWAEQLRDAIEMGKMGFEDLLYGLDDDSHDIPEKSVASDIKDRSTGELLESLTDGTTVEGSSKDTFFTFVDNEREIYTESLHRVKKYIPMIKKIVRGHDKNYDFNILGCRSGLLDTNKLAEAYQGIPQVYVRKGQVRTNKTTVCILIDESGSMGWGVRGHLSRADLARDTAILLNESLKSIPGIDLYIYGHSGDMVYSGATEINVYREGKKEKSPFALGKVRARSENRDGTAILETAKRVRKFTSDPVLMFIISDGSPSADFYRGYGAVQDTASKVKQVEGMGFNTVAITICSYRASEMYPRNIDLSDDLSILPLALGKIVKKLIIQDKKTTTTTV